MFLVCTEIARGDALSKRNYFLDPAVDPLRHITRVDYPVSEKRQVMGQSTDSAGIVFASAVPIFRIFDEAKAREFYLGFLGCTVDWEHRFHPGAPLYCQLSRGALKLHLSEHHGDFTPGSTVVVYMEGVEALQRELIAKNYRNNRPGLQKQDWGLECTVIDPFHNQIRFLEARGDA